MRPLPGLAVSALAAALPFATGAQTPEALALPCANCHGPDGRSAGAIPAIAGLSAEEIVASMVAFQNDELGATIMNRIAKGYSPAELEELARYLATQAGTE